MSFFDSFLSSYSPDEARSRLFYVQHRPSLLTELRRTRAGQRSSAGHARASGKTGKGGSVATWLHKRGHRNCTGHLAACTSCSVQERYCTGRLAQQRWWGEGVPYNFFAPPSHSIIWRWGLVSTTYNSPSCRAGRRKRATEKEKRH